MAHRVHLVLVEVTAQAVLLEHPDWMVHSLVLLVQVAHQELLARTVQLVALVHLAQMVHLARAVHQEQQVLLVLMVHSLVLLVLMVHLVQAVLVQKVMTVHPELLVHHSME
jgi:hypothetical protein